MTTLKIAFIGSGFMAREHARAFASLVGVKLTGVYGRTPSSAQQFASEFNLEVASSIPELYKLSRADLVVIAVDELSIVEVVVQSFQSPWALLIEKPPGYRPVDAALLVSKAREMNSRCFVALNRRFMSSSQIVSDHLQSNNGIRFISVTDQEDLNQAEQLGQPEDVRRHWMYANAIHVIDLMRFFGRGRILEVRPLIPWKYSNESSLVVASVHFESGDIGLYKGIWNAPGPWSAEIVTSTERYELRPLEKVARQLLGQRQLEELETSSDDLIFKPGLLLQAKNAVSMLKGERHSLPTLVDAIETMNLVEKIYS